MSSPVRVKIEGVAELKAALEELGEVTATKVGVGANREAAKELRTLLAIAAPYDASYRKKYWRTRDGSVSTAYYGHLKDAIRVRKVKARTPSTIVHIVSTGKGFWGHFLEFGTIAMAARPWFRPVVDVSYNRLFKLQTGKLGEGIEREARRIARKNRVR